MNRLDTEPQRIDNAIRHIESSLDVDPWACEIAVNAMKRQMPQVPMQSVDVYNNNLIHLYCPTCGSWVGMRNVRLKAIDMHNNTNGKICARCGQVLDLEGLEKCSKGGVKCQN